MKVRGMQFDGEDAVNRNIDEQTSGHRMIRRDLEDADEALTEGHRAIRAGG